MTPTLRAVAVPDHPERWAALGFEVIAGAVLLPGVRVVLDAPRIAVAIEGVAGLPDGLELEPARAGRPRLQRPSEHRDRHRPRRRAHAGFRRHRGGTRERRDCHSSASATPAASAQGFRRLGDPILELVEASQALATAWWGLTITVKDLGALPPI